MAHGKPVIATNYSGNTEFMNTENSFLVDAVIQPVEKSDNHFDENTLWGSPVEDSSINKIIEVFSNQDITSQKALLAKQHIDDHLSYASVGKILEKRVNYIFENLENFNHFNKKINIIKKEYLKSIMALNSTERELKKIKKNVLVKIILFFKKRISIIKTRSIYF